MSGLTKTSGKAKGKKRARKAEAAILARGSEYYTGITPPKAARSGTPGIRPMARVKAKALGGIRTPLG